jgi:hypothetical protein
MYKKMFPILLLLSCALNAEDFYMNLGTDFNFAHYRIDDSITQKGYLAGPHFDVAYKRPCSIYTGLNFDGRWNAGFVTTSAGVPQADVVDFRSDWKIGYYFLSYCELYSLIPYTGLGFQHLFYKIKPNIMTYKYYQLYLPLGFEFLYNSPKDFTIGLRADYRAGAYTKLAISTPNVASPGKLKLKYSHGVHVAMPVYLHYLRDRCVGLDLSLIPFFDWNRFAKTTETNGVLPFPIMTNKRWYVGVNANIGINF